MPRQRRTPFSVQSPPQTHAALAAELFVTTPPRRTTRWTIARDHRALDGRCGIRICDVPRVVFIGPPASEYDFFRQWFASLELPETILPLAKQQVVDASASRSNGCARSQ